MRLAANLAPKPPPVADVAENGAESKAAADGKKAIPDKAPDEISGEVTSLAMIADVTVTVDIAPGDLEVFVDGPRAANGYR